MLVRMIMENCIPVSLTSTIIKTTMPLGIVDFMIVGVKDSGPYVVKSCPVVPISGEWLSNEIHSWTHS